MTTLAVNVYLESEEVLKYNDDEELRKEIYQKVMKSFAKKMKEEEFIERHLHLEKVEDKDNARVLTFSIDIVSLKTETE